MHQPFGLTGPSTFLQDEGAIKRVQLLHFWLPLGEPRYPTDDFDILDAKAGPALASMTGTAPAAQAITCKIERREIPAVRRFVFSVMKRKAPLNCTYGEVQFAKLTSTLRPHLMAV